MIFQTIGNKNGDAILFFHAMGVTGESSLRIAEYLKDKYYIILPTSTVYCEGQRYISKDKEIEELEAFLSKEGIERIKLLVSSSLGADLALAFLSKGHTRVDRAFFDGGQFAQLSPFTRRIMTPILYYAIRSLYKTNGRTLKKILWCDDEDIKPYFIKAGKKLTYSNLKRQMSDSLENKPFPPLRNIKEENCIFEFGSIEEHFKYRPAVMAAYPGASYPVFSGFNHMEYQIKDPKGFAVMLDEIIEKGRLPNLAFLKD